MLFHQSSHFNSSPSFMRAGITNSLTTFLVAGLLGIHLTLLAIGSFCASATIKPNPSHHQDHQSSTFILCVWACHVAQIAASGTPTEILSALPILIFLWVLLPLTIPLVLSPFSFASARGPPLF